MSEPTPFQSFVDYIVGDDNSELGRVKAERDYALHCLEREIAICQQTQARNEALVKALRVAANALDAATRAEEIKGHPAPVGVVREP